MLKIRSHLLLWCSALLAVICLARPEAAPAQSGSGANKSEAAPSVSKLEDDFFGTLREADTRKFLSYVTQQGVNLGTQRATREDIEQQFLTHRGLYCKLFDSSCIEGPINLDNSARPCSYRELLTHSEKVNTASSEMTRSGVRQAVLVARIKNDQCSSAKLIDFIFNEEAGGWKLFSIP